jgi:hypothetical protein
LFDQNDFDIRCEAGEEGASRLALGGDVVIVVDVIAFSKSVSVGISRGATVYPLRAKDETSITFAKSLGAELADTRGNSQHSLPPTSQAVKYRSWHFPHVIACCPIPIISMRDLSWEPHFGQRYLV